jgi:FAD/FMN-containing dehydrogenase
MLDKTGDFVQAANKVAEQCGYPLADIGVYIQPKHRGSSYHMEFNLPYDPDCIKGTNKAKLMFEKASRELSAMGAYFSRPYGIWSQLQLNKDAQNAMVLKELKGIFDPNHIMNPGKLTVD